MHKAWPGSQGGTYGGNAVACAAAVRHPRRRRGEKASSRTPAAMGARLRAGLETVAAKTPGDRRRTGLGLMLGSEFTTADGQPDAATAARVQQAAADEGLLLLPCGAWGNVVRMIPALVVDETADRRRPAGLVRRRANRNVGAVSAGPDSLTGHEAAPLPPRGPGAAGGRRTEVLSRLLAGTAPGMRVDTGGRTAAYAYDASNYRVPPRAVAFPRSAADVAAVLNACRELGIPVTARGGGTSMAGNAIGPGVVLDFSRHMNRVLDIDPETAHRRGRGRRGARRPAGRAAAQHGLHFGPDPSSHSRCTLGGMIGNDACGNHSVRHGRTGRHVESSWRSSRPTASTRSPTTAGCAPPSPRTPRPSSAPPNSRTRYGSWSRTNLALIRTELGRIPRQVSGYHLQHLLPENGFDVARALVGTEGTCAVVVAATVALVATAARVGRCWPSVTDDVVDAADDVPEILR